MWRTRYAIGTIENNLIWCSTDSIIIHVTRNKIWLKSSTPCDDKLMWLQMSKSQTKLVHNYTVYNTIPYDILIINHAVPERHCRQGIQEICEGCFVTHVSAFLATKDASRRTPTLIATSITQIWFCIRRLQKGCEVSFVEPFATKSLKLEDAWVVAHVSSAD